jgi:hypothetical protein
MRMSNLNPIATARTAVMATRRCASILWPLQQAQETALFICACHASPTRTCPGTTAPRRLAVRRNGHRLAGLPPRWSMTSTANRSTLRRQYGRGSSSIIKTAMITATSKSAVLPTAHKAVSVTHSGLAHCSASQRPPSPFDSRKQDTSTSPLAGQEGSSGRAYKPESQGQAACDRRTSALRTKAEHWAVQVKPSANCR